MQKFMYALTAAALLASTAAQAEPKSAVEAKLAAPVAQPTKVIVDGRLWRCAGDTCLGTEQGDSQSVKRECARASKVLGPIVAYRNGHRTLTDAEVSECSPAQVAQKAAPATAQ